LLRQRRSKQKKGDRKPLNSRKKEYQSGKRNKLAALRQVSFLIRFDILFYGSVFSGRRSQATSCWPTGLKWVVLFNVEKIPAPVAFPSSIAPKGDRIFRAH
jgi:hypothetical protein